MNAYTGPAQLEWWANPSTMLGCVEISLVIDETEAGWDARGHLVNVNGEDLEGFHLLCELDPVFTLRLADGSTFTVAVHRSPDGFTLTEEPTAKVVDG